MAEIKGILEKEGYGPEGVKMSVEWELDTVSLVLDDAYGKDKGVLKFHCDDIRELFEHILNPQSFTKKEIESFGSELRKQIDKDIAEDVDMKKNPIRDKIEKVWRG